MARNKKWYIEEMEALFLEHYEATGKLERLIKQGKVLPQCLDIYGVEASTAFKWLYGRVEGHKSKLINWVREETYVAEFNNMWHNAIAANGRINKFLNDSSLLGWVQEETQPVEPTEVSRIEYDAHLQGISHASGSLVTIVGERTVVTSEGEQLEQYLYHIEGHQTQNGQPFVSLKENVSVIEGAQ